MIVIISSRHDAHLPFVTRHLTQDSFLIIDAQELIDGHPLSFSIGPDHFRVFFDRQELTRVSGVWVRRPSPVAEMALPIEERYKLYVQSGLKHHIKQLYTAFPDALWISDDYAINRAENKTLQLKTAVDVGFKIPNTLFTSDAVAASEFIEQGAEIVAKSQATIFPPTHDNQAQAFFATKLSAKNRLDFSGLDLAPTIFQELVDVDYDIRVTVVGDQAFATKIVLSGVEQNTRQRDWRLGYVEGSLYMEPLVLPASLSDLCITLTKELGLQFGAIDLVQDKTGNVWFLEINPNGQWAFIEEQTKQPIGKSLAALLLDKNP